MTYGLTTDILWIRLVRFLIMLRNVAWDLAKWKTDMRKEFLQRQSTILKSKGKNTLICKPCLLLLDPSPRPYLTLCEGAVVFCPAGWAIRCSHPPHRFQTSFDSVSEWLAGANNHLKTLSGPVETSDLDQEGVQRSLIKLLVRLFCVLIPSDFQFK